MDRFATFAMKTKGTGTGIKPASAITQLTWLRRARIDDGIAAKRARVYPRSVTAGVGIVCHPGIALDMRLKHEHVPVSRGNHSRRRCGSGEAKPVRGEVQFGHDPAEDPQ